MSTTSGWRSRAIATAARPSAALPDHLDRGSRRRAAPRAPRRNSSWSSTTSTRTGSIVSSSPLGAAIGSAASTDGAGARTGRHGARAAQLLGPLPHGGQAYTRGMVRRPAPSRRRGPRTRSAVASRRQRDRAGRAPRCAACALVTASTDDPVRRHLDRGGQRLDVVVRLDGPRRAGCRVPCRCRRWWSPARWRRADTRPNWSRAGGRSPSTRRRTSAISSRARSASRATSSAARAGRRR